MLDLMEGRDRGVVIADMYDVFQVNPDHNPNPDLNPNPNPNQSIITTPNPTPDLNPNLSLPQQTRG